MWRQCLQAPGWPAHSCAVDLVKAPAPVPRGPVKSPAGGGGSACIGSGGPDAPATTDDRGRAGGAGAAGGVWSGVLQGCIKAAAEAVAAAAEELDEMDSRVGDGDCGTTLGLAAAGILQVRSFPPLPFSRPSPSVRPNPPRFARQCFILQNPLPPVSHLLACVCCTGLLPCPSKLLVPFKQAETVVVLSRTSSPGDMSRPLCVSS